MRHNRLIIFTGALGALIVMTVLSAAMGFTLPNLIPRSYTHYAVRAHSTSINPFEFQIFQACIHLIVSLCVRISLGMAGVRSLCRFRIPAAEGGVGG